MSVRRRLRDFHDWSKSTLTHFAQRDNFPKCSASAPEDALGKFVTPENPAVSRAAREATWRSSTELRPPAKTTCVPTTSTATFISSVRLRDRSAPNIRPQRSAWDRIGRRLRRTPRSSDREISISESKRRGYLARPHPRPLHRDPTMRNSPWTDRCRTRRCSRRR